MNQRSKRPHFQNDCICPLLPHGLCRKFRGFPINNGNTSQRLGFRLVRADDIDSHEFLGQSFVWCRCRIEYGEYSILLSDLNRRSHGLDRRLQLHNQRAGCCDKTLK